MFCLLLFLLLLFLISSSSSSYYCSSSMLYSSYFCLLSFFFFLLHAFKLFVCLVVFFFSFFFFLYYYLSLSWWCVLRLGCGWFLWSMACIFASVVGGLSRSCHRVWGGVYWYLVFGVGVLLSLFLVCYFLCVFLLRYFYLFCNLSCWNCYCCCARHFATKDVGSLVWLRVLVG